MYTTPFVYVNDTTLLCTSDDPKVVGGMLQHDLDVISKWFVLNKLTVNVSKTKVMFMRC